MNRLVSCVVLTLLHLAATPALALDKPSFVFTDSPQVTEGDSGQQQVKIGWTFSRPVDVETRFTWRTDTTRGGSATAGADFIAVPPTEVVVAAGQQSGSVTVVVLGDRISEPSELLDVIADNFRGGGWVDQWTSERATSFLINDDDVPPLPLVGRDDYLLYFINEGNGLTPGENDYDQIAHYDLRDTTTTVVVPPEHGTVSTTDRGSGLEVLNYTPEPDFAGRDRFRYRLCKAGNTECVEATVHLQGTLAFHKVASAGPTGWTTTDLKKLPALADARYVTSQLAKAVPLELRTTVDPTPHLAWDSQHGLDWEMATLPATADGRPLDYRIVANWFATGDDKTELYLGVDSNGDGLPSADEVRCVRVEGPILSVERTCDMAVEAGPAPVRYWVAMHSREDAPRTFAVDTFAVRMDDPGTFGRTTGPAIATRGDTVRAVTSWTDLSSFVPMVGYVRVFDGSREVGEYQIYFAGLSFMSHILLRNDGAPIRFELSPSSLPGAGSGGFFDIPPGVPKVSVTVDSAEPLRVGMTYIYDRTEEDATTRGDEYVAVPDATTVPGQRYTMNLTVQWPGRYKVNVATTRDVGATADVRINLHGSTAKLLPGSYYNPARAGSGLLLYPAGKEWAGLWYTYDLLYRPTWYYLQAPKPGADGIWRAPLYRAAWNGASARHTQVGYVVLSPRSDRTFVMDYMIDGLAGSQPMEALGRGCPIFEGQPLDISSHWFDPARSGNGYSVQTWANGYQFIAAFGYDHQGYPQFLAGERADLGGPVADLPLEYLSAPPPVFDYRRPQRTPAGTLRRVLDGRRISEIGLEVDLVEPWYGGAHHAYSLIDRVQLLGGAGTTQGCAP